MATRRIERLRRPFALDIALPGSKSIALRQLLISSLADAPSVLDGVAESEDGAAMLGAVARLGCEVERQGAQVRIVPGEAPPGAVELDLGMSGTSLRLLLARAMLRAETTRFTGHAQLHHRPNADLLDALAEAGCRVESADGFLPIAIAGLPRGRGTNETPPTATTLRTSVSSQYLSGLMLSAPRLARGLTIRLEGERTSASYLRITEGEMRRRGASVEVLDEATVRVPPARYQGGSFVVEGDASAATYHAAMATLHGGSVTFGNLGDDTRQGDYGFIGLCERIGATVERRAGRTRIEGPQELKPLGTVDMGDMPDAAPTAMAMAPFLPEPTRIEGIASLRVKECDRIACSAKELRKSGVAVEEFADAMAIQPCPALGAATFETYEDHRMAMALSVLASMIGGCTVLGAECVAKTYAAYWEDFDRYYDESG